MLLLQFFRKVGYDTSDTGVLPRPDFRPELDTPQLSSARKQPDNNTECTFAYKIQDNTRKLSYRKDDRAMRRMYGCPENFR